MATMDLQCVACNTWHKTSKPVLPRHMNRSNTATCLGSSRKPIRTRDA